MGGFDPKAFLKFVDDFDRPVATPSTSPSSTANGLFGLASASSMTSGLFGSTPASFVTSGPFGSAPASSVTSGLFGLAPVQEDCHLRMASTITNKSFEEARWEH